MEAGAQDEQEAMSISSGEGEVVSAKPQSVSSRINSFRKLLLQNLKFSLSSRAAD